MPYGSTSVPSNSTRSDSWRSLAQNQPRPTIVPGVGSSSSASGRHDHETRPDDVLVARPQVADPHAGGPAVGHEDFGGQRLGHQAEVRVGAGGLAEDDVGARPGHP